MFVGLLTLIDPARPEVPGAISDCHRVRGDSQSSHLHGKEFCDPNFPSPLPTLPQLPSPLGWNQGGYGHR